jgi:hypothetical protein
VKTRLKITGSTKDGGKNHPPTNVLLKLRKELNIALPANILKENLKQFVRIVISKCHRELQKLNHIRKLSGLFLKALGRAIQLNRYNPYN